MKGKILLLTGLAVGYVLGTRAGRERYEEIKATANKLWNDPRVQKPFNDAQDFAKDKGEDVAEFMSDAAKKVVSQVTGKTAAASKPAASKPAATKPTTGTSSASKPASTTK